MAEVRIPGGAIFKSVQLPPVRTELTVIPAIAVGEVIFPIHVTSLDKRSVKLKTHSLSVRLKFSAFRASRASNCKSRSAP